MGFLLIRHWRRTRVCLVFHSLLQKELVCIIPPSFTVTLCSDCSVYMPAWVHEFLLRIGLYIRRRILRARGQLRSRKGRRHHDNWSWLHRVQQNLSFVIIPLSFSSVTANSSPSSSTVRHAQHQP